MPPLIKLEIVIMVAGCLSLQNKRFLITGADGQLARAFQKVFQENHLFFLSYNREKLDITQFQSIKDFIGKESIDIIINCAAYNDVDGAERDPEAAMLVNAQAVRNLAESARDKKAVLVHFSTDYVFDGQKNGFYVEEDTPNPLGKYAISKWQGEAFVKASGCEYLILRLSWLFGEGRHNFLYKLQQWAKKSHHLRIATDEFSIPTFTQDVADITILSLANSLRGLFHLTNSGPKASRYDFALHFVKKMGLQVTLEGALRSQFPMKAQRPGFSCMSNKKIAEALRLSIPSWQSGIERYVGLLKAVG